MVDLTPELIAVLSYTAVALFLSLYFVPFKVVPKAWAKAVNTEGHPAKKALDAVLDRAVAKIVMPKVPEMPDLKAFEAKVDAMRVWMNDAKPLLDNLTADNLKALMSEVIANHKKGDTARAGIEGRTTELQEVASIGAQAAEHPEAAMAFNGVMKLIDIAESMMAETDTNIKKIAKARKQAQAAFEDGEDLIALRDQFAKMFPTAYANFAGAPASGGAQGGGSGVRKLGR